MSKGYKQLYRSREERMIGGVCAGIGEYFGIDPTLIRLGFVLGALLTGVGPMVLTYIIMLIVVPEEPLTVETTATSAL